MTDSGARLIDLPVIAIPVKTVIRRLGYPKGTTALDGEAGAIFREILTKAPAYIHPVGIWRRLTIRENQSGSVSFREASFCVESRQVSRLLETCDFAGLFMTTIGPQLENEVKQLMDQGEMTAGVMLDAVGSETADAVADWVHRTYIAESVEKDGLAVTPRFSPGYGDWPVTIQSDLHSLCEGNRIGISVSPSSLMFPRKSVSAVLGLQNKV